MKELFETTAGFGDVCLEKFGRLPSIETLERVDVRPGNVKNLPTDSGVNPIAWGVRVNYTEFRRVMVEIRSALDKVLPHDGVEWLISLSCDHVDEGNSLF